MDQFGGNIAPENTEDYSGKKKLILGLLAILIILGGLWYLNQSGALLGDGGFSIKRTLTEDDINLSDNDLVPAIPQVAGVEPTAQDLASSDFSEILVSYTNSGFEPREMTIFPGQTITFINSSDSKMWVASDDHPAHLLLPAFDQKKSVEIGGTYSFTFNSSGEWTYHNHVKPSATGLIFVR